MSERYVHHLDSSNHSHGGDQSSHVGDQSSRVGDQSSHGACVSASAS